MNAQEIKDKLTKIRLAAASYSFQRRGIAILDLCDIVSELIGKVDELIDGEGIAAYKVQPEEDDDELEMD